LGRGGRSTAPGRPEAEGDGDHDDEGHPRHRARPPGSRGPTHRRLPCARLSQ
jgi:hypothetical protein